ncbi:MAG: KTSC domain-containing protein [Candidatus Omnitrophota bacterium]|nr:KTSC domain-containing protein [Candidatus Omnitrophota bacterium]
MDRTAVRSREIAIVGYDEELATLEIAFRRGGVYRYQDVPVEVHRELLKASSIGTYFTDNIKEKYSYEKVNG